MTTKIIKGKGKLINIPPEAENYQFFLDGGFITLKPQKLVILYKVCKTEDEIVSKSSCKRIEICNFKDPWLTITKGNVLFERETINDLFINITFRFDNKTLYKVCINDGPWECVKGEFSYAYKVVNYDEIMSILGGSLIEDNSIVIHRGDIREYKNLISHNLLEDTLKIELNFTKGFFFNSTDFNQITFLNERGDHIEVEEFYANVLNISEYYDQ